MPGIVETALARVETELAETEARLQELRRQVVQIHTLTEGLAGMPLNGHRVASEPPRQPRPRPSGGVEPMTSAIEALLTAAGGPISLDDLTAMTAARRGEPQANKQTSVSLSYLAHQGKAVKTGRGLWAAVGAAPSAPEARKAAPAPKRRRRAGSRR